MSEPTERIDAIGALRRQWWIVALCVVVALAAGAALAYSAPTEYTATAVVRIDPSAVSRATGLPAADEVLRASKTDIRTKALADSAMAGGKNAADVRFSAIGAPQTRVIVTATGSDENAAKSSAGAFAKATVAYAQDAANIEIARQERKVALAKAALARMPESAAVIDRWTIEDSLADAQAGLDLLRDGYSFDGEVSAGAAARGSGLRGTLSAALLLGAFLGMLLGGVREYLLRRKAE